MLESSNQLFLENNATYVHNFNNGERKLDLF